MDELPSETPRLDALAAQGGLRLTVCGTRAPLVPTVTPCNPLAVKLIHTTSPADISRFRARAPTPCAARTCTRGPQCVRPPGPRCSRAGWGRGLASSTTLGRCALRSILHIPMHHTFAPEHRRTCEDFYEAAPR